jgi:hypothetical protein
LNQPTTAVVDILDTPRDEASRQNCIKHAAQFSWPEFGERLRLLFKRILDA